MCKRWLTAFTTFIKPKPNPNLIKFQQQISGSKTFTSKQTFTNGVIVTQPSTFTDISANRIQFTNTLNNIPATTFSYLTGVTSNIQAQFNSLSTLLTNISFDAVTNTQSFASTTSFPSVVALPFPVVYLHNRNVTYPLLVRDMGLIEDLNGLDTTEIIAFTIFPNCRLSFLDANKATLVHIQNDAEEIMYNVAYQFIDPPGTTISRE
jgi:hypothetical protein